MSVSSSIDVTVERLSPRAVFLRVGKTGGYTEIAAVSSRRGVVLIDTGTAPSVMERFLDVIGRELGRRDVTYVINTHSHGDHNNGNQLFAAVPIIAHERARGAMGPGADDAVLRDPAQFEKRVAMFEERLRSGAAPLDQQDTLPDIVSASRALLGDMKTGRYVTTPPNLTFTDRMTLDLGDATVRLIYLGAGIHTDNDVLVLVPEDGLLFVGDAFSPVTFRLAASRDADMTRCLDVLNEVLRDEYHVTRVISSHWGSMSRDALARRRDYMTALRDGVRAAIQRDARFSMVSSSLALDTVVSTLATSVTSDERASLGRWHEANVRLFWAQAIGSKSAASLLEAAINAGGIPAMRERLADLRRVPERDAYFDEGELNQLGYSLMAAARVADAIALFSAAVEVFPGAANLHDSLGEAYVAAGDVPRAIRSYETSLRLNPANANAAQMLERLRRK